MSYSASLDKGVKELDANPYFFLFLYMIATKSQTLIQEALKNIQVNIKISRLYYLNIFLLRINQNNYGKIW